MYYVDSSYRKPEEECLFENENDALEYAKDKASEDNERYYYFVTELLSIVKAAPIKHPVKVAKVEDVTIQTLIGEI
jgi:DNA-directed RNA polymerase subunit F